MKKSELKETQKNLAKLKVTLKNLPIKKPKVALKKQLLAFLKDSSEVLKQLEYSDVNKNLKISKNLLNGIVQGLLEDPIEEKEVKKSIRRLNKILKVFLDDIPGYIEEIEEETKVKKKAKSEGWEPWEEGLKKLKKDEEEEKPVIDSPFSPQEEKLLRGISKIKTNLLSDEDMGLVKTSVTLSDHWISDKSWKVLESKGYRLHWLSGGYTISDNMLLFGMKQESFDELNLEEHEEYKFAEKITNKSGKIPFKVETAGEWVMKRGHWYVIMIPKGLYRTGFKVNEWGFNK